MTLARIEHLLDADRVPRLERPELPAEAPLHRAVHVVDGVGNLRGDARGVDERGPERVAQEAPTLSLPVKSALMRAPGSSIARAASSDGSRAGAAGR